MQERRICNPGGKCVKCGNQLTIKDPHHFVCRDCYVPGIMYTEEVQALLKGVNLREVKP